MKELEDYDWFPNYLRKFQMDVIGFFVVALQLYKPIIPELNNMIQKNENSVVDICSGSGQPALYILKKIPSIKEYLLTDLHPQKIEINNHKIHYNTTPLNVLEIKPESTKSYTMFNAFHHFSKKEQQRIVSIFKEHNTRFLFAEILQPNLFSFLQVLLASTIGQLIVCPFIQPFSIQRIIFTYFIPINIVTVLFDGIVSVFKSSTAKQYGEYLQVFSDENYNIEIHTRWQLLGSVTYIKGYPKT